MGRPKQPELTVTQILDVAYRLFLENGYEQTTMQDIVDNTDGLSRGAIYHHFKSKEDIINAVSERLYSRHYDFDFNKEKGNALEKFRNYCIHSYNAHVESDFLLKSGALLKNPKYFAIQFSSCVGQVTPQIADIIREGNRDGSMNVKAVGTTAEFVALLLNVWCIPAMYPGTAEQAVERFKLFGEQCRTLGFPFVNEELLAAYSEYAKKYTG